MIDIKCFHHRSDDFLKLQYKPLPPCYCDSTASEQFHSEYKVFNNSVGSGTGKTERHDAVVKMAAPTCVVSLTAGWLS
jgi:hypothetical protein